MNQAELTGVYCSRPQNFAWFLGAGTSRTAGLPTATDVLWDLKRRYYCREENQDLSQQDIQNPVVRDRLQAFVDSRGFPEPDTVDEYATYFEKIFGEDRERQRKYLNAILSEEKVTLTVGHRALGALMASGLARAVFTTNFDSVVERAVADVSGRSIAAYHLEGSANADDALNNEEYPLYCKLHGDFRYDSVKNLSADLASQDAALASCFVNAGNRFGLVVAGYSGRDASVMNLLRRVLAAHNPFPHGLFWTGMRGSRPRQPVVELLELARSRGVTAEFVEIETFDTLMLQLWRNIESKPAALNAKVHRSQVVAVSIPMPVGTQKPVIRLNALPVDLPAECLSLVFRQSKSVDDVRRPRDAAKTRLILSRSHSAWCWGLEAEVRKTYGEELQTIGRADLPTDFTQPENQHVKGFLEEALCWAVARGKSLISRTTRAGAVAIAKPHGALAETLAPLTAVTGAPGGLVPGLMARSSPTNPKGEQAQWAEALRLSLEQKDGRTWLLLEPDLWIWPEEARRRATEFMSRRRADRFNNKHDSILSAWIQIICGTSEQDTEVMLRPFDGNGGVGNPSFMVGTRTAFCMRQAS